MVPKEATALYESAFNKFRERGEQEPMLLAWAGKVHSILFAYSGLKRLRDWLQVFEEIHPPASSFPSLQAEALVVDALAASYMFIAPDRSDARKLLDRAVILWDQVTYSARPPSKYFTEQYYIWFDDFTTVHALFREVGRRICATWNFSDGTDSPLHIQSMPGMAPRKYYRFSQNREGGNGVL